MVALICLAIVVPLVAYVLVVRWRADARFDAVTALWPSAYVVEGISCDPTTAGLFAVGGAEASVRSKKGFAVAFDPDGARFYSGGRHVIEFLRLTWSEVESIGIETVQVPSRQATALELTVARDDGPAKLPIVIKATRGVSGFRYSSPVETDKHLKAILSLRGTTPETVRPVVRSETPTDAQASARGTLAPGVTSVGMTRFSLIAILAGLLALLAMLPFGILTWTGVWSPPGVFFLPFILVGIGVMTVGRMVGLFVPMRESAELRAGYTLSRDGDTNVDQLDPKTGYVIRPAGHPALTRDEEKSALLRVRASGGIGIRPPMGADEKL
ncbi:hypothetical protein [Leifsonia sp. 2MCAF36]|uniref:hypothetical protein n=1 Tax=Leifsonia sp. 2MCAF36 TaxID=3232988 RepID=UPI003F9C8873